MRTGIKKKNIFLVDELTSKRVDELVIVFIVEDGFLRARRALKHNRKGICQ